MYNYNKKQNKHKYNEINNNFRAIIDTIHVVNIIHKKKKFRKLQFDDSLCKNKQINKYIPYRNWIGKESFVKYTRKCSTFKIKIH